MHTYFKINPTDNTIMDVLTRPKPIPEYNTKETAAENGKPYLVEAIVGDPPYDPATHIKSGPVDAYEPSTNTATRTYVLSPRTTEDMAQERIKKIEMAVQQSLDAKAREHGYDSVLTAVTYDDPADSKFQKDAKAFRKWRSQTWRKCYDILEDWQAGNIPDPSVDDVLVQLPAFEPPGTT